MLLDPHRVVVWLEIDGEIIPLHSTLSSLKGFDGFNIINLRMAVEEVLGNRLITAIKNNNETKIKVELNGDPRREI